jgi:hypothetical protein
MSTRDAVRRGRVKDKGCAVATLVRVGAAAGDLSHNDKVALGKRIEDYPPFADSATECAARSLEHLGVAGIRIVGHRMQRGLNTRKLGVGGPSESATRTISEHETPFHAPTVRA